MKKILTYLLGICVLLSCALIPDMAFAKQSYEKSDACEVAGFNDPLICGTKGSNEEAELQNRVRSVLNTVYLWIGIIAVVVTVIGGIQYMTAQGEPEKARRAKMTITYSIIGLIVTLSAFAMTTLVINALDGNTTSDSSQGEGGGSGGGGKKPVEVRQIRTVSTTSVTEGQELQLRVAVVPDYADDRSLTFSSDDESVATVSSNGKIEAKKPGEATITVKSNNGVESTTKVVVKEIVQPTSITLNPTSLALIKGKSGTLTATVLPRNAADKTVTWSSSDKAIAIVDSKGKVKGIDIGEATITAKTSNGIEATAQVSVKEKSSPIGGGGGGAGYTGGKGSLTAEQRQKIVEFSETQIGTPYNYGPNNACGGGSWTNDIPNQQLACNGLTRWAYDAAGLTIPKGSIDQMTQAPVVTSTGTVSDMTAGDIIVYDDVGRRSDISNIRLTGFRHVAIYAGDGQMIEATCPVAQKRPVADNEYSYSVTW